MAIDVSATGSSTVVLTLAEKSKLDKSYYTFLIRNKDGGEEQTFCATDISSYPSSYNKFVITLSENSSPLIGRISAAPGQYSYYVYESVEPGILDVSDCAGLVETGMMYIRAAKEETKTFEAPSTVKVWGQNKK